MARDTRERILDAASRLFSERGFDGTPVAEVLSAAGVRSGSLYHFFPSKEALAEAVLARCADRLSQLGQFSAPPSAPPSVQCGSAAVIPADECARSSSIS